MRHFMTLSILGILLVSAGVAIVKGFDSRGAVDDTETAEPRLVPVDVTTIEPVSEFQQRRTYTGTVVARRRSDLAFERSAELISMEVDDGDLVQTGQVLASLDVRRLNVQRQLLEAQKQEAEALFQELKNGPRRQTIEAARAEVRNLSAQRDLRKRNLSRDETLHQQNAVTRQALDESELFVESFDAQVAAAEQQLDELVEGTREERIVAQKAMVRRLQASIDEVDVSIEDSVLTAPFDGRIARRHVDEGVVVSQGSAVLELIETTHLEARIALPVETAFKLTKQIEHKVLVGGAPYRATEKTVLPDVDLATRTRMVVFELDEAASQSVVSGEIARVEISETLPTAGYWLPQTALTRGTHGLWSVYAVVTDERGSEIVERREVEVIYTQSDRVLSRGTLENGDRIVSGGLHRVVPGQAVSVTLTATGG